MCHTMAVQLQVMDHVQLRQLQAACIHHQMCRELRWRTGCSIHLRQELRFPVDWQGRV